MELKAVATLTEGSSVACTCKTEDEADAGSDEIPGRTGEIRGALLRSE